MSEFYVPDADFQEVDKEFRGEDDLLCWAAASCSALWYSQWVNSSMSWVTANNTVSNFQNPTDVFKYTQKYFRNWGGFAFWHMMWMISGSSVGLTTFNNSTFKQEGGGEFYELTPQETFDYIYCVTPERVLPLFNSWESNYNTNSEKCGVTVGVRWGASAKAPETRQDFAGGHEVSVWGFRYQGSDFNDPRNLTGIQIADPDDKSNNTRYWLNAQYNTENHLYQLTPSSDPIPEDGLWDKAPSVWVENVTLIRQKPSNLKHVKNERVAAQ